MSPDKLYESSLTWFYRADQVHLWLFMAVVFTAVVCGFIALIREWTVVADLRADRDRFAENHREEIRIKEREREYAQQWRSRFEELQQRIAQLLPDDEDDE